MSLKFKSDRQIVLASASPRRKELLSFITDDFGIVPSNADENISESDPEKLVMKLARLKAEQVAQDYSDSIVIGADTLVFCNEKPLGKPNGKQGAFDMLKNLAGKVHKVITGVCIVCGQENKIVNFAEISEVKFRNLSDEEILEYIQLEKPFDMAGAYAIQSYGGLLAEWVHGDFNNIIGLPVCRLAKELNKFN